MKRSTKAQSKGKKLTLVNPELLLLISGGTFLDLFCFGFESLCLFVCLGLFCLVGLVFWGVVFLVCCCCFGFFCGEGSLGFFSSVS